MNGFKRTDIAFKFGYDRLMKKMVSIPTSPREDNEKMLQAGFTIDRINKIYIKEGFGAFKTNISDDIQELDDLRRYCDGQIQTNPYSEIVRLMDEEGYEFVLGPEAPLGKGNAPKKGLYCKNYKEILERQKRDKQKQESAR